MVRVFVSDSVPLCRVVVNFFRSKGVEVQELNVANLEHLKELRRCNFKHVPVTVINGKMIAGFDGERFRKELEIMRLGKWGE